MTLRLSADIVVRAAPERVFELICAPERLPEWNVSVERARRAVPDEPVCLGSRAIFSGRLLGQPLESETEVVEYQPPCAFATRAIRGPRLNTRFALAPAGDSTRVQVDVSGEVPGGAIGERLAEGFLRRELSASMQRLRELSER
ncbi:MAG: SRPBCC family protein [Chloroflexi bacterium]|nr:SRPBCC family protein [Chloroflexota bacterium]